MKKLAVFLLSLALSSTSFADRNGRGGGDDWVGPFILGGVIGAVIGNNMRQQNQTVNVIRVEPPIDCRSGVNYRHPSCYIRESNIAAPVYFESLPSGTPPRGYHYEQEYFENCSCLKWTVQPN